LELSDAKTFLGQCVYKKRRKPYGKTELYDFRLRINTLFNRYPNSSALKVHFLEADEIWKQLEGAEKMECDGKTIKRNL